MPDLSEREQTLLDGLVDLATRYPDAMRILVDDARGRGGSDEEISIAKQAQDIVSARMWARWDVPYFRARAQVIIAEAERDERFADIRDVTVDGGILNLYLQRPELIKLEADDAALEPELVALVDMFDPDLYARALAVEIIAQARSEEPRLTPDAWDNLPKDSLKRFIDTSKGLDIEFARPKTTNLPSEEIY